MKKLLERANPELLEWLEMESTNYPYRTKAIKEELEKHYWWTDITYEIGLMLEECGRKNHNDRVSIGQLFNN